MCGPSSLGGPVGASALACEHCGAFLRSPSVSPLPGPALTMDREPGRGAAGEAEAAAAAAFGGAGPQVGWRRCRSLLDISGFLSVFPFCSGKEPLPKQGGAARPLLPGLSGMTLGPPVASERKRACPGKAVFKVAKSQGLQPMATRTACRP